MHNVEKKLKAITSSGNIENTSLKKIAKYFSCLQKNKCWCDWRLVKKNTRRKSKWNKRLRQWIVPIQNLRETIIKILWVQQQAKAMLLEYWWTQRPRQLCSILFLTKWSSNSFHWLKHGINIMINHQPSQNSNIIPAFIFGLQIRKRKTIY